MRRVLFILFLAGAAILLAWQLLLLPGTVSADIGDLAIDLPVPVAALGLIFGFLLFYLAIRLIAALIHLPRTLCLRRAARHRRQGDHAVTFALVALAAGDAGDARRQASRARRLLGDTPQTLLLTSEAGRLAGRTDETENALRALAARKDSALLGLRGLLRDAMARQDWVEAAALARQAEAAHPGAIWLRAERAQLAVRAGAWAEALALTSEKPKKAALAAAAAQAEENSARALRLARQAFDSDPSLTPAALAYATRLREAGRERRAQAVLRQAWTAAPHQDLADLALAPTGDSLARVQAAQRLAAANPNHAESHFLLARTDFAAGLTGEARRHVAAAHEAGMNQRRLWSLLADIEELESGPTEASRAALKRAAAAEDDPGWQCFSCGTAHPAWRPACTGCGATGALHWGPRTVVPLPLA
jgi:HemY protein